MPCICHSLQRVALPLQLPAYETGAVFQKTDCSPCHGRHARTHCRALCGCNAHERFVQPADCYDGDVMDRLAHEACKRMESFTSRKDLSSLVSTCCRTPCECGHFQVSVGAHSPRLARVVW